MTTRPLVLFTLDGERFALDATRVRETVWLPELTPIEEAPPWVVGLFSLRGQIVPVVDLHLRFGHPLRRYRPDDQVLVVECDPQTIGLIVDEVSEVVEIAADTVQPPPQFDTVPLGPAPLVGGEVRVGDDLVALLDLAALLHLPPAGEGLEAPGLADGHAAEAHDMAAPGAARDRGRGWFCPEATPAERALFHARAMALQAPATEAQDTGLAVAVVELGREHFGVELAAVREFCDLGVTSIQVTPIPCCPPHILGAMSLRGDLITLVDPRAALNLPPAARGRKVVVARLGEQSVGLAVDAVHDVVYLGTGDVQPAPAALGERHGTEIAGIAPYQGRTMIVLDLPALLARADWIVDENA